MRRDAAELASIAAERGFAIEDVERVVVLMSLLQGISDHSDLGRAFALKGGAALNLFLADLPRHSRDIDLNYVEDVSVEQMLARRPALETALRWVCTQADVSVAFVPREHAGGTWRCRFLGHDGRRRNVEFDVTWMARVPLWPLRRADAISIGAHSVTGMQLLSLEELAVGKILALLERSEPRDVFDVALLFERGGIDLESLRAGLVALSASTHDFDLRRADPEIPHHDPKTVAQGLQRLLVAGTIPDGHEAAAWAADRLESCRRALRGLLRLRTGESAFLDAVLDRGEIQPSLLDCEQELRDRIARHPGVRWRAQSIASHRAARDASPHAPVE